MNIEKRDTGFLFRNKKKEKETQPDYNGDANIDGVQYRIAAWLKESEKGGKYFSFKFTAVDDGYEDNNIGMAREPLPKPAPVDDVPF